MRGVGLKHLNKRQLDEYEFDLPELNEQRRIVEILSQIRNLINNRKRSIELLDEYTKSLFLNKFGNPISDPKEIGKKPLSFFGNWKSGGTPPKSQEKYFVGDIPWFTSGELESLYVYDSKTRINAEAIKETSAKLVDENSLMIGMYDTAALKTSISLKKCSCNQAIAFSKLDEVKCSTEFIYFNIIISKEYLLNKRKGVRQKNFNLTFIKNIEVLNPPLKEQEEFANQYSILNSERENYIKSLNLLEELFLSVLYKTFRKSDKKEEGAIDFMMNDELRIQKFLDDVRKGEDYESLRQYDIHQETLFNILERTEQKNKGDIHFKKGIVQFLNDENEIELSTNREYQLRAK